jgi:GxxExxY protein
MSHDLNHITESIIGCAYTVGNTLGHGFLEKVYENALSHELAKQGLSVQQQISVKVRYDDVIVGDYIADILVENSVLIEVKAVSTIHNIHLAQCMNYLKATGYAICLLINFGKPRVEVKRVVVGL